MSVVPVSQGVDAAVEILNEFANAELEKKVLLMPREVTIAFMLSQQDSEQLGVLVNSGKFNPLFGNVTTSGNSVTVKFDSLAFADPAKTAVYERGVANLVALLEELQRADLAAKN